MFLALKHQFPAYVTHKGRIELRLPSNHPDLRLFLDVAQSLGLRVGPDRAHHSQIEILDYSKYSESEIDGCVYLECLLHKPVLESVVQLKDCGELGFSIVDSPAIDQGAPEFGSIPNLPHLIVVCGSARVQLEASGLHGLRLIPLISEVNVDKNRPWNSKSSAVIWSYIGLPSIKLPLFDNEGHIFDATKLDGEELEKGYYILDGYEVLPALSYEDTLSDFDIAITRERFGGASACYHRVVYSKKAESVLRNIGMQLERVPVRAVVAESK